MQRIAASSFSLITGSPQEGHTVGKIYAPSHFFSLTQSTSGIISPAFLTVIVSPMLMFFSLIKSWLWSVARLTVVPARCMLSNIAVGVNTPVLPTAISMSFSVVCFSSGGYLKATAHFGYLAVEPKISRCEKSSTLITAPSISNSRLPRSSPIRSISVKASSMLLTSV